VRRLRRPGLRAVLLGLVLAGVVPVVALTIHADLVQRGQARRDVQVEAERLTRLAVLRHGDLVDAGRDVLLTMVQLPAVRALDPLTCSQQLEALQALYPRFAVIGLADAKGDLLCSGLPASGPLNFADRAWFQRTVATGAFAVGDYQVGRISGRPTLVFGYPLFEGSQLRGVAFAALDLAWLQQFADQARLPAGAVLLIADAQGRLLARAPSERAEVGSALPERRLAERIRQGRAGAVEGKGGDGAHRLFSVIPLTPGPEAYASLAVGIPTSTAYADADRTLQRNLLLLAVIALLGTGVAWMVANRFLLRPTDRVLSASGRLAAGDLGARAGPPYRPGELGEVARAFDGMARALERREREISQSRAQLQAILDNAPVAIYMKDLEGHYLLVNNGFEQLTGVGRLEALGRTAADVHQPSFARVVTTHDEEVLQAREPRQFKEIIPGDEGTRTFRSLRFPLFSESSAPYAVCGITTEITEEVRAEAERVALENRLQQVARMESLGKLAGGVAHDFNNLLAVILNYADFVLAALPEEAPEELQPALTSARDDVKNILLSAEKAAALTRQLLIFARRDQFKPSVLDLNEVVADLEPLLRRTLGEDVRLEFSLKRGLWPVRADRSRLEQVMVNLSVNARDAMPGGGSLSVTTENVVLEPDEGRRLGLQGGPYMRLTVVDTGTGMSPDVAARAIEPFFTTKPKGQGTGLGLATVFGIVADAGGQLLLDTRVGKGTTIQVYLPTSLERPLEVSVPHVPFALARGETVLVVEDEEPVREVARRILAESGYAVLTAPDGSEALRVCREHDGPIDLLLTDVVMPGLSGPELVEQARLLRPDMRALYISGYPEDFLARRHDVDKATTLLGKPFTAQTLLRVVRFTLDQEPNENVSAS
jgi:PAS domain S-box-containing protein